MIHDIEVRSVGLLELWCNTCEKSLWWLPLYADIPMPLAEINTRVAAHEGEQA